METDISSPLVTVIIPLYNAELTVMNALQSAQAQSHSNLEILVYDDASTDSSSRLATEFSQTDPRVRVFKGIRNQGAGYARNFLLAIAKGQFFAFLDSDDAWFPDKIEKQVRYAEENRCKIVTAAYEIVDSEGRWQGIRIPPARIGRYRLHIANWLPTSMTLVSADLVSARDMPLLRARQDYGYWLQIFRNNNNLWAAGMSDVVGVYTRRPGSLSSNRLTNLRNNYSMWRNIADKSVLASLALVLLNSLSRLFRI